MIAILYFVKNAFKNKKYKPWSEWTFFFLQTMFYICAFLSVHMQYGLRHTRTHAHQHTGDAIWWVGEDKVIFKQLQMINLLHPGNKANILPHKWVLLEGCFVSAKSCLLAWLSVSHSKLFKWTYWGWGGGNVLHHIGFTKIPTDYI